MALKDPRFESPPFASLNDRILDPKPKPGKRVREQGRFYMFVHTLLGEARQIKQSC